MFAHRPMTSGSGDVWQTVEPIISLAPGPREIAHLVWQSDVIGHGERNFAG